MLISLGAIFVGSWASNSPRIRLPVALGAAPREPRDVG